MFVNKIRDDGFGAQYQSIIASIIYSEQNNKEFIYSKPNLEHVYEKESNDLHNIINLENSFRKFSSLTEEEKKQTQELGIYQVLDFFENNIDFYLQSKAMKKIINLYIKQSPSQYDDTYINVAVHIRRCSIHKNIDFSWQHKNIDVKNTKTELLSTLSERFLPDDYYLNIIKEIKLKYTSGGSSKLIKFHIFSEGTKEDFKNFDDISDIQFHLNESIPDTFSNLVHADILVTSASSFSYVAALLSTNIIYAKSFWHKHASHWISK